MSEDTKLQQLIINTLSPEQMPEVLSETEIYLVEDDAEYATVEELATKQDVITDLDNYIKNTDLASSTVTGVVNVNADYGINTTNTGRLFVVQASDNVITSKNSAYRPLTSDKIDLITKTGLTTNSLTLTEQEQDNAQSWLGFDIPLLEGAVL